MKLKDLEVSVRQEVLQVATGQDNKTEAHREYFDKHIDSVHRALKEELLNQKETADALSKRVDSIDAKFEKKTSKLEGMVMPAFDNVNKRRKVDYDDLKGWLMDTIDSRLDESRQDLEKQYQEKQKNMVHNHNTQVRELKQEISALKRDLKQAGVEISGTPAASVRGSTASLKSESRVGESDQDQE